MADFYIPPDHGHSIQMGGLGVVCKLSGSQTGGAFSIVEHPMALGTLGAPLHTHSNEDELSYILEGEVNILLGEELIRAAAGSYVFKPRGAPHAFWNASDKTARILEIIIPAGFEKYFEEVAPAFRSGGLPDVNRIIQTASRYGLQMHIEKLGELA
jgi:mannose-6-phosphate isomerase-like protein (cupin superfamily)